ncbi:unnamed protein product [Boreogadus saida]
MWGQEDHSHWRSLIPQPQTAELSRSSGGRGSDELRRRDQQDVRIRVIPTVMVILQIHGSPTSSPPLQKHVLTSSTRQGLQHGSSIRQGLHRLLHQAGPPSAPPPGRAFSLAPPPGRNFNTAPPSALSTRLLHQLFQHGSTISSFSHGYLDKKTLFQCKGSRRHSFRVKVRTTEKEEEGEGVESSEVMRIR